MTAPVWKDRYYMSQDGLRLHYRDYAGGRLTPGEHRFGLVEGAFELPASGGFLDDAQPLIDDLRDRIRSGAIEVPRFPPDRGPPR